MNRLSLRLNKLVACSSALLLVGGLGLAAPTDAAVLGVDSVTTTPALPGSGNVTNTGFILDSLTIDGTVYDDLSSVTEVVINNNGNRERMWATNGTDPGSVPGGGDQDAIVGLDYATGLLNVGFLTQFRFGRTLAGDERIFILRDAPSGGAETITLEAIDGSGDTIGDYSITITGNTGPSFGDYGNELTPAVVLERENGGGDLTRTRIGVSFLVSDLVGTTGDLSQIEGLRTANSGNANGWDVTAVGIAAVIPEPSSLALCATGLALISVRRRKDC